MKLFLPEEASDDVRELWAAETPVVTSWITFAETSAAIAGAWRARRISRRVMSEALRHLDSEWPSLVALHVDEPTARQAAALAPTHRLRGMDAIHLASALTFVRAQPVVVTWDAELRRAARAEGLAVFL